MNAGRSLSVLTELVAVLERGRRPEARPIVHDRFAPEEPLFRAVCNAVGGVYINADGRPPGAQGPLNRPLARVVKQAFCTEGLELNIDEHAGEVCAAFPDHADPSPGLALVLRIIEILCSAEVNRPLVMIAYPLAELDAQTADLLWRATTVTFLHHPPPRLQVAAPVAIGDVSVARHCKPNSPVRLAVRNGSLIRRGGSVDLDEALGRMLHDRNAPIVFFLGAGASVNAGISLGDALRDEALRELLRTQAPTQADLINDFRDFLDRHDRWRTGERELDPAQFARRLTLERVMREQFLELAGRPRASLAIIKTITEQCRKALKSAPSSRSALHELVGRLPRSIAATVNFDELIEDQLPNLGPVLAIPEDFEVHRPTVTARLAGTSEQAPVLKLHGTINNPDSLVADIDQTEAGLPRPVLDTLDAMIAAVQGPLTWVWVGCSMRDADLRPWLQSKHGIDDLHEFWVDPLPAEGLYDYAAQHRAPHWATRRTDLSQRLITETSDQFFSKLLEHVKALRD